MHDSYRIFLKTNLSLSLPFNKKPRFVSFSVSFYQSNPCRLFHFLKRVSLLLLFFLFLFLSFSFDKKLCFISLSFSLHEDNPYRLPHFLKRISLSFFLTCFPLIRIRLLSHVFFHLSSRDQSSFSFSLSLSLSRTSPLGLGDCEPPICLDYVTDDLDRPLIDKSFFEHLIIVDQYSVCSH